eukprot:jgi/Picre1/33445/NNA_008769.t1
MISHNEVTAQAYQPSYGQLLALLRNGMPVPVRPVFFPDITAYLDECRRYKEMYLREWTPYRRPPSAIDQTCCDSFGHPITTQKEAFVAWKKIQATNKLDFELQYLVHCELVRNYRVTGCCLGVNWNQVIHQHKIRTKQDMYQYHLRKYGFKFQQQGGLRLPLEWQPMISSKTADTHLRNRLSHVTPSSDLVHPLSHTTADMLAFIQDLKAKIPSFTCLQDYITYWDHGKSSNDRGIYIYSLVAAPSPSPSLPRMYVGQTSNLAKRLAAHRAGPPLKIQQFLSANGTTLEQTFHVCLLDYTTSRTEADDMESHYINYYSARTKGFNSLVGRPGHDKSFWATSKANRKRTDLAATAVKKSRT